MNALRAEGELRSLLTMVLDRFTAGASGRVAEAIYEEDDQQLTRFGGGLLVQNVARRTQKIDIRVQQDGRQASLSLHQFDPESIARTLAMAEALLKASPADPKQPAILADPQSYKSVAADVPGVADHDPNRRAEFAAKAQERAEANGLSAAGRFEVRALVEAYANSHGLFAMHPSTEAIASVTMTRRDEGAEGWGWGASTDPAKIGAEKLISEAEDVTLRSRKAQSLPAGDYTVVLEPAAVSELLRFLSGLALGGQELLDRRNPLAGRMGEQVFGPEVCIRADPFHPLLSGRPFDFEGVPTERLELIDKGRAASVCWDRRTAALAGNGQKSTGHGNLQPDPYGPRARNLVMEGQAGRSVDDLVRGTAKGLLVRRFHYGNVVDPRRLSVTGMTRSGVFEIENGQITRPVKNFRFTVSLFDVLSRIEDMSEARLAGGALFGGRFVAPGLKVRDFTMSSTTEF